MIALDHSSSAYVGIPAELRAKPNFVVWRYVERDGKKTKVPFDASSGKRASTTDPGTWATFDTARTNTSANVGLGFVFDGSGFVGVDLDKCRDPETGEVDPGAAEIIKNLNSYTEVSPSGTGFHVILRGVVPPGGNRKGHIELYDRDRFFCMTGYHLEGTPQTIENRQTELEILHGGVFGQHCKKENQIPTTLELTDLEILNKARAASNGKKFRELFDAGSRDGYPSQSEADSALCTMLAFWFDREETVVDRLFRRSALMRPKWDSKRGESTYGADTVRRACQQVGRAYGDRRPENRVTAGRKNSIEEAPNLLNYGFHDAGNADRLVAMIGNRLRYCFAFRKWLVWDERRWAVDDSGRALHLAKRMAAEFLRQAVEERNIEAQKFARFCLNARQLRAALELAAPELAVAPTGLDTDPWLLNCLNGTVDLRNGELSPHDFTKLITKLVHHRYIPEAKHPVWTDFLYKIMGIDRDEDGAERMVDWLQKLIGYSLTGSTREKVAIICHGCGDNGKTTLLATIREVFEEYAALLQVDTLMGRREDSNNAQADLADLCGARFVMTSETEAGQRLAEAKLKRITQGMGRIKTARKYENPFEFKETHKLWLDANHKPVIQGAGNAIWNRLRLIPFDITIPKHQQDQELGAKLLAEAEGILAWVVAGAVRWYAERLGQPLEVSRAGTEWRQESDVLGDFIEQRCVADTEAKAFARDLYGSYCSWCAGVSETAESQAEFTRRLASRGFIKKRTKGGVVIQGIRPAGENNGVDGNDG